MSERSIKHIAILGNGISAWVTANCLSAKLRDQAVRLTVIGSSAQQSPAAISTTPAIHELHRQIGLSDHDLVASGCASYKLGNHYRYPTRNSVVPFDPCGEMIDGVEFHHFLHRLEQPDRLDQFSIAATAARNGRVGGVDRDGRRVLASAWHLDCTRYRDLLRQRAIKAGVHEVVADRPPSIRAGADDPTQIQQLEIGSGSIATDFVFDASDWRIAETRFGATREDWAACLPTTGFMEEIAVADRPTGLLSEWSISEHGWARKIPLPGRTVIQHYVDDRDSAANAAPSPGRLRRHWSGNVLTLGKTAGDPLDFVIDEIHLTLSALLRWLDLYPDRHCEPALGEEFNRLTNLEYDRVRDAHSAHYLLSATDKRLSQTIEVDRAPPELRWRVDLFQSIGKIAFYEADSLAAPTWTSLLTALGFRSARHDQLANRVDRITLRNQVDQMAEHVRERALSLVPHDELLTALNSLQRASLLS